MRKKTRRILIIIMAAILAFVCFFLYSTTGKRSDIKERNEIKKTVEKALRIKYGWMRNENIKDIATIQCQKQLKMSTYDYVDSILYNFQEKMEHLNALYFGDMFGTIEKTFNDINETLASNRNEIKEMAYRTESGQDELLPSENEEDPDSERE